MMFALLKTTSFLWIQSALTLLAVPVFGAIGYWYGYVSWFVSARRLKVLVSERDRLSSAVDVLREKVGDQTKEAPVGEQLDDSDWDDFTLLPGVDAFACARLHQAGVRYFDQLGELEELSEAELEKFRLSFGVGKFRVNEWRWAWGDSPQPPEPADELPPDAPDPKAEGENDDILGLIFMEPPEQSDQLVLVDGICDGFAIKLNQLGIYQFAQIASWDENSFTAIEEKLSLPIGLIEGQKWRDQAKLLAGWSQGMLSDVYHAPVSVHYPDVVDRDFADQTGIRIDEEIGIVYDFEPDVSDDLCQLEGVVSNLAQALNRAGVWRYRQIANWSAANVDAISGTLGIETEQIEAEKWIPTAGLLDRQIYAPNQVWTNVRPSADEINSVINTQFADEDLQADEDLGIVYADEPSHADDLTALDGLDSNAEFALNSVGIWCVRQIALWSATNVEAIAERLRISPDAIYRQGWIRTAGDQGCNHDNPPRNYQLAQASRELLTQGARLDSRLGLVFDREPAKIDDLKQIKGIGPKVEEKLRQFGIYRFDQIALWTPGNAQEFGESLPSFRGRMIRDKWQEQADALQKRNEADTEI